MNIGITGGIGSGKTTVCRLFEKLYKIPVYYADSRAKKLMTYDQALKSAIKKEFGPDIYHSNGRLNRAALAAIVFNDKKRLSTLNALVHPAVYEDGIRWFKEMKGTAPYLLKEAALLYESDSASQLDKIIVVHVDDETRIARVMKRDRCDRKSVLDRMNKQMDQQEKMNRADYLINNADRKQLLPQIKKIHLELLALSQ